MSPIYKRGLIALAAVLLIPWMLWAGLIMGGWALLLIVPAVLLYWGLTKEFYSKNSDGIFRFARSKDTTLRTQEKEAQRTSVADVPSAAHTRAQTPNQTPRRFTEKHRHPIGSGVTLEPR